MNFGIIGGDSRQLFLKKILENKRYETCLFGSGDEKSDSERAFDADVVIFPMPVSRDGVNLNAPRAKEKTALTAAADRLHEGQTVFGGMFPEWFSEKLKLRGINLFDYGESEYLTRINAVLTAEGAVGVAVQNTPFSIFESEALVVGFGRIGKVLSRYLSALGARVTVSARKESDLADIRANGFSAIKTAEISNYTQNYNFIFNTVPTPVLGDQALRKMQPDCALIELASRPGGTDIAALRELKIDIINAPSLPGRYSPEKAAQIIFEFIRDKCSAL